MGKKQKISRKSQFLELLSEICEDNFSLTPVINNEVINCYIDPSGNYIEVFSMPEKKGNQVILYRNKDIPDEWKVLRIGDKLSLFSEWDFHITTFNVLGG